MAPKNSRGIYLVLVVHVDALLSGYVPHGFRHFVHNNAFLVVFGFVALSSVSLINAVAFAVEVVCVAAVSTCSSKWFSCSFIIRKKEAIINDNIVFYVCIISYGNTNIKNSHCSSRS